MRVQTVDRSYWINKSTRPLINLVDDLLGVINEKAQTPQQLNYTKFYIGLTDGNRASRFIHFSPKKKHLRVAIPGGWTEERSERFDEAEIDEAGQLKNDELIFNLNPAEFKKHRELVGSVIHEVVEQQKS